MLQNQLTSNFQYLSYRPKNIVKNIIKKAASIDPKKHHFEKPRLLAFQKQLQFFQFSQKIQKSENFSRVTHGVFHFISQFRTE